MEPGWDGDVELHEGRYWSVSLCDSVCGSVGGGVGGDVDGADGVGSVLGVGAVLLAMVVATIVGMWVKVG